MQAKRYVSRRQKDYIVKNGKYIEAHLLAASKLVHYDVEVTSSGEYPNPYNGDIVIPGTVTWEGKVYQVTEIGYDAFSKI